MKTPKKAAPKPADAKPAARDRTAPSNGPAAKVNGRALVRVYRGFLGDCILIRLRRADGSFFKIMIDCGAAVATTGAAELMTRVVEDVGHVTDHEIDVLVITHEHWDHVSGFTQAADAFKKLKVHAVWLAWTEDERDELAQSLRRDHAKALGLLTARAQAINATGDAEAARRLLDITGMFGASGEKTGAALASARALPGPGHQPKFWRPADSPFQLTDPKVSIFALGPPHDAAAIRKTLPSKVQPETYEGGAAGDTLALTMADAGLATVDALPFPQPVVIPMEAARGMTFFQSHYWSPAGESQDWRRIDADWMSTADDLALALQSATNNTSLVLAIQFADGDVMLFVGDAQVGNWLSWQNCAWNVDGTQVTGPELIERTVFYKVGHHGSHNATLREKGLDMMKRLRTAVVPVDHEVAVRMRWGAMPLNALVEALEKRTGGRVLRTDIEPESALDGVHVDKLYYEIEV